MTENELSFEIIGAAYLQQTKSKLGLLLNFNVPVLKNGIHRIVLGLEE